MNGKKIYTWTEKGEVVCLLPNGDKMLLGKGQLPFLKAISDQKVLCLWEFKKEIYRTIIEIL
ncbi:MAG: hypothetical protein SH818_16970 [Saprospiraceae bacterium]|nr:hypothetical protein [Saprospiraceae bacterium]